MIREGREGIELTFTTDMTGLTETSTGIRPFTAPVSDLPLSGE